MADRALGPAGWRAVNPRPRAVSLRSDPRATRGLSLCPVRHRGHRGGSRHRSSDSGLEPSQLLRRGSPGPGGPIRKISGLTTDDLDVIQSLQKESKDATAQESSAATKRKFIAVPLDSDKCVNDVAAFLNELVAALEKAGQSDDVGVGVLSMLGFDSTYDHILAAGVDVGLLDFMICNSGADVWLRQDDGHWDADENYESTIAFHWDRIAVHRMLKKIISAPADNHHRLPRLKELLYNVAEVPESGVHPRHICIELDPETQGILAAGMGPKARAAGSVRLATAVTDRLKRRLRTKGFRANYTLQFVPKSSDAPVAILHITPVRASRPLALRSLSHRLNVPMDAFTVVTLPPVVVGDTLADAIVGPATSDMADLIAGAQKAYVVRPKANSHLEQELSTYIGTKLAPFQDMQRVQLAERSDVVERVVKEAVQEK